MIRLAEEAGLTVTEQILPREILYLADELFMTGTAAEITPIRSVDGVTVRCGGRGPITKQLQELFHGLFRGATQDTHGWLEPVGEVQASTARAEPEAALAD